MTQIKYSVLRYTPNLVRAENIIVGVAIHVPDLKLAQFFKIKNSRRVSTFDDEYDKDYFAMVMDSLEYEFTFDEGSLDNNRFLMDRISDPDFLTLRTQSFANEFRFDSVNTVESENADLKNDVDEIVDLYLYYDKAPASRITPQRAKSLLSKQVKAAGLKRERSTARGAFNNDEVFDFEVDGIPTKTITFDYARETSLKNYLKGIVFDIQTAVKNFQIEKINVVTVHEEEYQVDFEQLKQYLNEIEQSVHVQITVMGLSNFSETIA
ncbi:DUF3037 domain-containing protein [Weissella confusa]|uniref:DUF3037 domain-containing protein n=1 Tax=Weissella fermenti TaxID=2987699 RepID=A0ABT6D439_9LACO|nr:MULTISPECIES: DUF3037 domain-containing protein [Weissella]MBJ7689499.1 DUF3037 domain-containing protein [Weissella confusa]MCW0926156.1 DUF3037 domain-containing protein [Weissella sp. LMG 11983]MDF9300294.1 DUF3037 domain-containing protein [Weissella sp. BK2]